MMIVGVFAGMRHIAQFNESLKKSFLRASRAFQRQKKRYRAFVNRITNRKNQ